MCGWIRTNRTIRREFLFGTMPPFLREMMISQSNDEERRSVSQTIATVVAGEAPRIPENSCAPSIPRIPPQSRCELEALRCIDLTINYITLTIGDHDSAMFLALTCTRSN